MTTRTEVNVQTGVVKEVELTQAELDAAAAAKAAEDEFNSTDNVAIRQVDAMDRLWREVNFDQENRIRALERAAGQTAPAFTKAQYRDALIARHKALP